MSVRDRIRQGGPAYEPKLGWKNVRGVVRKGKFKPHKHRREIARRQRQARPA